MAANSQNQNESTFQIKVKFIENIWIVIINIDIAFKAMHIFKSALHYFKYYKLAVNAFLKRNLEIFLKSS